MRTAQIKRQTKETDISLSLNLDGTGIFSGKTGIGFLDHMLTLFASHGRFDLDVNCKGDTQVDDHHSVEDIGICLGKAFKESLSDMAGINRYGNMILPMDETLILTALDISGRMYLNFDVSFPTEKIGDFDSELVEEFFLSFARNLDLTLHIKMLEGKNSHHIAEAIFKGTARALKEAVAIDPKMAGKIPSTKGTL